MMIDNVPAAWDMEADVVAIGSGLGGLGAAITAHDHGASALVLERADKVGGVTAISAGEVWVPANHHAAALGIADSPESGFRYLSRLSMGYGEDSATLNLVLHASEALSWFEEHIGLKMCVIRDCPDYFYGQTNDGVAEGRLLEVLPFPAETLGEWQQHTRVSPLMPYGMTHVDMYGNGGIANMRNWDYALMGERLMKDERCLGAGLAAYFVKGVIDRGIPMHTGINVDELIGDGERIVGVRGMKDGKDIFVRANRGVVVAVSSYERTPDFNKTLSNKLDMESMLFPTIDGASFRLTGPVGAKVAKVPDTTSLGIRVPGEETEEGLPLWRNCVSIVGLPHGIVVNRMGERFGNESFYHSLLYAVDAIDGNSQTHPNFPCWVVIDSQAREKYPLGSVVAGQDLPEGLGVKADTLEELARLAGIDPEGLAATVARFNGFVEQGEDRDFKRGQHKWSAWMCGDPKQPVPNLGTVAKAPFYAVRMHRLGNSGLPATGVVADHHNRAIDWHNRPIPGLYVAGNAAARIDMGAVVQSGVANARGMTHGYLAGRHAAGQPSGKLEAELERIVG